MAIRPPLNSASALLFATLSVFCLWALPARAQSVGGSCSTAGQLATIRSSSTGELLYCGGSTWGLGEALTSTGVGIGTASPAAAFDVYGTIDVNEANGLWQDATNENLAVGKTSLPTTVSQPGGYQQGQLNTAVGYQALNANTTAGLNTAIGATALAVDTTGNANTAVGAQALSSNSSGAGNTAIGASALSLNTTGISNTAIGQNASELGTTGTQNVAVGYNTLTNNVTGSNNTAVGEAALAGGSYDASSASYNTGIGNGALADNTTGGYNTALGASALLHNSTGVANTALGYTALYVNATGSNNTVVGYAVASTTLTTGSSNILIGTSSAVDTPAAGTNYYLNIGGTITGTLTAGTGGTALTIGTSSDDGAIMTFAGEGAITLPSGTSAQRPSPVNGMIRFNSTVPQVEAYYNSTWNSLGGGGSSTITLGTSTSATNPQRSGQAGTGFYSDTSNQVEAAVNSTNIWTLSASGETVNGQVWATSFTPTSDTRLKKNIVTLEDALENISKLRGVSFDWRAPEEREIGEDMTLPTDQRQIGVIAQEVEPVFPELVSTGANGVKSVNYNGLIGPLIEAVKEQQREISAQQQQIEAQQREIDDLKETPPLERPHNGAGIQCR